MAADHLALYAILIHPHLDIELEYYDLSVENRDATNDRIPVRPPMPLENTALASNVPPSRRTKRGWKSSS
jgi:hypothetical protein